MATPADNAASLGAYLRGMREQRGLSAQQAAQEMHVGADFIAALERDEFASLGAAIFVRGHLRNYARLLGLNENEVLASYEHTANRLAPPPLVTLPHGGTPARRLSLQVFPLIAVAVLVVLGIIWWLSRPVPQSLTETASQPAAVTPANSLPEAATRAAAAVAATELPVSAPPPRESTEPVRSKPEPVAPKPVVTRMHAPVVAAAKENSLPPAGGLATRVKFTLSAASWIEVYDASGKRLYYDLAPAGDNVDVSGAGPLQVFLGNAPGVSIELNGKPFNQSPFTHSDNTARFKLGAAANGGGQAG